MRARRALLARPGADVADGMVWAGGERQTEAGRGGGEFMRLEFAEVLVISKYSGRMRNSCMDSETIIVTNAEAV